VGWGGGGGGGGGGGVERPEKKHTVCGQREAGTGVRTAHVDRCKIVAVLNKTPRVGGGDKAPYILKFGTR
jgi:hypothetical protein